MEDRAERTEDAEKTEVAEKAEKVEKAAKAEKAEVAEKAEKSQKAEKAQNAEKSDDSGDVTPARTLPTSAWVLIVVVALALGVALGHFMLGGGGSGTIALNGRTTLSESELDSTIATYTTDGVTTPITARDVLTFGGTELTPNEEGTYDVPAASSILNYAQTQLMLDDAAKRGISVTDEDINAYLSASYGLEVDLATFASGSGITEEAARELLTMYVTISKLGEDVMGGALPEVPTEPAEPEEGAEDTPSAEYAEYVISLLGDEWDSEANTWARTDGEYYATLSGYEISNDAATYAAASAAYAVATSNYQNAYTEAAQKQDAYTDELFSKVSIQIGTLAN